MKKNQAANHVKNIKKKLPSELSALRRLTKILGRLTVKHKRDIYTKMGKVMRKLNPEVSTASRWTVAIQVHT